MADEHGNRENGASAGTLSGLAVKLLLAVVLIFGVAGALLLYVEYQEDRQAGISRVQTISDGLASRYAAGVAFYSQVLVRYVAGNPSLGTLLRDEAWRELERYERQLSRLLPDAMRVRILPREWDKPEPDAVPPVSFATLEMLRGVERSGNPSIAEVHQFGLPQPHVSMAVPVLDSSSGDLAGVVQLALPMTMLEGEIANKHVPGGRIELQQVVEGEAVTLASAGTLAASGAPDGDIPVAGSLWRLAYWGGSGGCELLPYWDLWGGLSLALLLSAAVLLIMILALNRRLLRDRDAILVLIRGLIKGEVVAAPPRAAIPEFQRVMDLLAHPGRLKVGKSSMSSEPSAPKGEPVAKAIKSPVPEGSAQPQPTTAKPSQAVPATPIASSVFRAYDIRGLVGDTLTTDVVHQIGRAIGSEAQAQGEQSLIIARDGRDSSESLSDALASGLVESGLEVVDLGMVPTPVLYFATQFLGSNSGVMVTGSHNPPEYNGLKVVIAGETLSGHRIRDLHRRISEGDLISGSGGSLREQDLVPDYIGRISEDVQLLGQIKLVIDCGNGVASVVAPALFRVLGCDVVDLYCEVDGSFPNHHPDPGDPRNLQALIQAVKEQEADLGVAFDGDGDRLGVVDSGGKIIWPDRLLMLLSRDVLLRQPGADVIYDVKSSRHLASEILTYGGRPIMWKSGHSLIKEKLRETGAALAGELTGHIYFQERWYGFDDALYACARLLEVLSGEGISSSEVFSQLPESVSTPALQAHAGERRKFELVETLVDQGQFPGAKLVKIDGIRAEFQDGWGLVRPSNTGPNLVFRFEADDEAALARIQGVFRDQLTAIEPAIELPF